MNNTTFLFSMVLIFFAVACKPLGVNSEVQTLDNFAAQKRIKDNSCAGRPNDRFLPTVNTIMGRVQGTRDQEVLDEIRSSLSAIPETLRSTFAALGGTIRVSAKPESICGSAKTSNKEQPGYEVYSCFLFSELKFGGGVGIALRDHPKAIRHSLVRQFGYFYSKYLSKRIFTYNAAGQVTGARYQLNQGVESRKLAVTNAFLKDVNDRPYFKLENFDPLLTVGAAELIRQSIAAKEVNYLNRVNVPEQVKSSFIDDVFSEAFDSFYCNAYAPIPDDLFKDVKEKRSLSESQLKELLKQTNNTRLIMGALFSETLTTFNIIHPHLFLLGPSAPGQTYLRNPEHSSAMKLTTNDAYCGLSTSPMPGSVGLNNQPLPQLDGVTTGSMDFGGFGSFDALRPQFQGDSGPMQDFGGRPDAKFAMFGNLEKLSNDNSFDTQIFNQAVFAPNSQTLSSANPAVNSITANAFAWGEPEPAIPSQDKFAPDFGSQVLQAYIEPSAHTAKVSDNSDALDFITTAPTGSASISGPSVFALGGNIFTRFGKACGELFSSKGDDAARAADAARTNRALQNLGNVAPDGNVADVFKNGDQANRLARIAGKVIPDEIPSRLEPLRPEMLEYGDEAIFFSKSGNMYTGDIAQQAAQGDLVHLATGNTISLPRIAEGGILRKGEHFEFTSLSGNKYSGIVTNAHAEKKMVQIMTDSGELQWLNADRLNFSASGMKGKPIDPTGFKAATAVDTPGAGYKPGRIFSGYHAPGLPEVPDQGWKLHVSAPRGAEAEVLQEVLPELRAMGINHKTATPEGYGRLFQTDELGQAGTQQGKLVTIYPQNDAQAQQVAKLLKEKMAAKGLDRGNYIPIPGEKEVAPGIFARYGQFSARNIPSGYIKGPDGRLVPDVRGQIKPDWIPDLNLD